MSGIPSLSVPALATMIRAGQIGAREVVADALGKIADRDDRLNAVVALDADGAMAAATAVDQAVADGRGDDLPPSAGVPTLIKDLNNARGLPTTFGTASMADFLAPFDDHAVAGIRRAGFIILGKSNVPELGSLPVTESVLLGPARNPWDPDHTPGGSSGGAAAAVAAGYVEVAHGSDGGGSIRIPASCCGLVGMKPSRGRVSHAPLFGDQYLGLTIQGPLGRRVVDVAAMLDAMQGYATGDPTHLPPPTDPYAVVATQSPPRTRIGMLSEVPWATPDDDVQAALAVAVAELERLGHSVHPMSVRLPPGVLDQFQVLWASSLAATPLPHDQMEPHNQAFGADGNATSATQLLQAFTSLQLTARAFVGACLEYDAVLAPVLMQAPPRVGALSGLNRDDLVDTVSRLIGLSPIANVTGQPAISLPVHHTDAGMPIGVQLIGGPAAEDTLLRLAGELEEACGWVDRQPPVPHPVHSSQPQAERSGGSNS